MKICILGDTHFGMRGDSLEFHRYYKKFYDNISEFIENFEESREKKKKVKVKGLEKFIEPVDLDIPKEL